MDQIQIHFETNLILHWKKSNYTLEQIQFNLETKQIAHGNKSNFKLKKKT